MSRHGASIAVSSSRGARAGTGRRGGRGKGLTTASPPGRTARSPRAARGRRGPGRAPPPGAGPPPEWRPPRRADVDRGVGREADAGRAQRGRVAQEVVDAAAGGGRRCGARRPADHEPGGALRQDELARQVEVAEEVAEVGLSAGLGVATGTTTR